MSVRQRGQCPISQDRFARDGDASAFASQEIGRPRFHENAPPADLPVRRQRSP
jgi:hypothetical protein